MVILEWSKHWDQIGVLIKATSVGTAKSKISVDCMTFRDSYDLNVLYSLRYRGRTPSQPSVSILSIYSL